MAGLFTTLLSAIFLVLLTTGLFLQVFIYGFPIAVMLYFGNMVIKIIKEDRKEGLQILAIYLIVCFCYLLWF